MTIPPNPLSCSIQCRVRVNFTVKLQTWSKLCGQTLSESSSTVTTVPTESAIQQFIISIPFHQTCLYFVELQVSGQSLMPLYEKLTLRNVSTLSLSLELCLVEPFALCEAPGAHSSATNKVRVSHFLL